MVPWKPASGAGLRFLRQELPPAVPSCQSWVNRSELYLGSPSLTVLQKQLPKLQRFDLTHQMVNISDRRNTNIGKKGNTMVQTLPQLQMCLKGPRQVPLRSRRLRTSGRLSKDSPRAAFHWHPAHPNTVTAYWTRHQLLQLSGT